ncbi:hypothetical protein ACFPAG_05990 [Vogesella sp. GCM10023246]|uniref:Transposase n=1 Tax=Vogesella oryzagri TaxID=3160864 RepID=A0ABV1M1Q2_9NEIS
MFDEEWSVLSQPTGCGQIVGGNREVRRGGRLALRGGPRRPVCAGQVLLLPVVFFCLSVERVSTLPVISILRASFSPPKQTIKIKYLYLFCPAKQPDCRT